MVTKDDTQNGNGRPALLEELAPEDLLAKLVSAHGVDSVEHLAGRTSISVRTMRRWQSEGYPTWWPKSVQLIRELGLLRSIEGGDDDRLDVLAEAVVLLMQSHERALADLRDVQRRLTELAGDRRPAPAHTTRQQASRD